MMTFAAAFLFMEILIIGVVFFFLYAHNIRIVNFDKITKASAAVDVSLSENIKSIVVLYDRHVE